ncbi:cyclic nucleotide-gated ion channel 1-like [Carya illinoinensis]|uniref:cyclic nucleotide-gated ion channel 1-like n=1 Tax=Carya illinoinensis TaxID=32201 RepID=UPI001C718498|nr:cyclic nucleotide-gated ion channel 1-like [Carya illinoinensis]
MVCVVAVAVDPLFFYLPFIDESTKCIELDTTLEIIAICVRSFLDLIAIWYLIARKKIHDRPDMKCSDYVINILSILPVPQVLVPIIFSEMRNSEFRDGRKFLNAVVLLQYVPRIFRIYRLWKIVNKNIKPRPKVNAERNKNTKGFMVMKAGFNLFLYLIASHWETSEEMKELSVHKTSKEVEEISKHKHGAISKQTSKEHDEISKLLEVIYKEHDEISKLLEVISKEHNEISKLLKIRPLLPIAPK